MKKTLKAGIFFALFMSIISIIVDVFILENNDKSFLMIVGKGIFTGAFAGPVFALMLGWFLKRMENNIKIDLEPGEQLVFETNASHFKGVEAVGGKLFLTDKRLLFKSHSLNIQPHVYSLPVDKIKAIDRHKTMGLINNGLKISSDTSIETFVVDETAEWQIRLSQYNNAAVSTF